MFVLVLSSLLAYANADVPKSQSIVKSDIPALNTYNAFFQQTADNNCIKASIVAALASRESNGAASLKDGFGDNGKAWEILQCDIVESKLPCTSVPWNSCEHIEMMVNKLLVPNIKQVAKDHPTWTKEQQLQGAVATYNFGTKNVRTLEGMDVGTAGCDYSNDVMARAQYLYSLGWN